MKTYTLNFDKLPFETLLKKNSKKITTKHKEACLKARIIVILLL